MGHVIEHIALEIQTFGRAWMLDFGRIVDYGEEGRLYHV